MKPITLSVIKDAIIKKGMRILKVQQLGAKTADECMPFGEDSNPLEGMVAIFAETGVSGEPVIIGYINKNQLAGKGEKRIYSLKEDGNLSSYIWLKGNEEIHINGNQNSLTKYEPLDLAVKNLDSQLNEQLTLIATAIGTVGGSYVPTTIQTNISNAKAEDLKCK